MKGRILIVDDDRAMCEMLEGALKRRGFECASRTSAEEALQLLASEEFDVIVTDLNMQGTSGLELCQQVVANRPDVPVVVVTAFGSLETAVGAIRAGAYDFVTKPFEMEDIALTLERAVGHRQLREEVKRLRSAVRESQQFSDMIGTSAPMQKVYDLIARVAETEATVLVTGESGTGKELVAKAAHSRSRRAQGPFVAINCAAMPEPLLESELFGHVKGAFTDARQARSGLFLKASGGTLFMDEIGEMAMGMQAKLLRVLQERTVRPVGGDKEIPFDTRIIAATNRDLDTEVAERRFREDLFYRINVVRARAALRRALRRGAPHQREGPVVRGRRAPHGLQLAGQRPRAPELHRASGRPRALRDARRGRSPREAPGLSAVARHRGERGPRGAPPDGGGRAALRSARAPGRRREQDARGRGARVRSTDALP
jgi:DNA-binding NtrC family response regulator